MGMLAVTLGLKRRFCLGTECLTTLEKEGQADELRSEKAQFSTWGCSLEGVISADDVNNTATHNVYMHIHTCTEADKATKLGVQFPTVPPTSRTSLCSLGQPAQSQGALRRRDWLTSPVYSLPGKP